jgi:hypothetical protein
MGVSQASKECKWWHKDAQGQEMTKPTHKKVRQSPLFFLLECLTKTTNGGIRLHELKKCPSQCIKGSTNHHFTFFWSDRCSAPDSWHAALDSQCLAPSTRILMPNSQRLMPDSRHIPELSQANKERKWWHKDAHSQETTKPMHKSVH